MTFQIEYLKQGDETLIKCNNHLQMMALKLFLGLKDVRWVELRNPRRLRMSLCENQLSVKTIRDGVNKIMEAVK